MAGNGFFYNATVTTSTPVTETIMDSSDFKKSRDKTVSYLIDATGAGTLQIETKAVGQSAFNVATSISGESTILDFPGLEEIKLTASTANVPVTIIAF